MGRSSIIVSPSGREKSNSSDLLRAGGGSFFVTSVRSLVRALVRDSGSFQMQMIPSVEAVIKCLQLFEMQTASVNSPHVVLHTEFPVAVSQIVIYLSAEQDKSRSQLAQLFESNGPKATLYWSKTAYFFQLSALRSHSLLKLPFHSYRNLSWPVTVCPPAMSKEKILLLHYSLPMRVVAKGSASDD